MKTRVLTLLACCALGSVNAQEFTGREANELIPGSSWVRMQEESNYPQFVQFAPGKELQPATVEAWFTGLSKNADFGLLLKDENKDNLGQTHRNYKITYKGVVYEHDAFKAHIKNGKVFRVNGEFDLRKPSGTIPILTESAALTAALNEVNANVYKWQLIDEENHLKLEQGDASATYYPSGDVVYVRPDAAFDKQPKLAWKFNIYAQQPFSRHYVYVDATNGDILFKENLIKDIDAPGTAVTRYSGTRPIVADSVSPTSFRLRQSGRGNGVNTWNMQNGTTYGAATDFFDTDNFWNNVNAQQNDVAGDAHWGSEMSYDYFFLEHGRNSIDGNGFALNTYIHYDNNYANAFWDGQRMTYGDGNGNISPLVPVDVVGHEITHGLTSFTANLIYQNEHGALNESFSDIFGTSIEHYARPNNANWTVGEDIGIVIRSMSNPNSRNDPDTYLGNNWFTGTGNNGGVHTNCGVQNYWYYLVSVGGSGTNDNGDSYNVSGIGIDNAGDIAFRNLTVYLSPSTEYDDARFYSILSAVDLYGGCSPEVETVTDAWYAVGVGNAYVPTTDADFIASSTESCSTPFTVSFNNLSMNGTSYTWDFGDGSTSTQVNPTHTFTDTGYFSVTLVADGGAACGTDTTVFTDYIYISPNALCNVILPSSGIAPTQTICEGKLYDSGGPNGNYGNGEASLITIAPAGAASVTLDFPVFDIEAGSGATCDYDYLEIYDGPSPNSPLIGRYCNTTGNPGTITSSGGAVTIRFFADVAVSESGFEMNWVCQVPNVPPTAAFNSTVKNACSGEFTFTDLSDNAPLNWYWDFGDGTSSTLQNPTHRYTQNGLYDVKLVVANNNGADSTVQGSSVYVNLSQAPLTRDTMVCQGQSVDLIANALGSGYLEWYSEQTGGNLLHTGDTLNIPNVIVTETFYVEEVIPGSIQAGGAPDNTIGGGNDFNNPNQFLIFDVLADVTLKSVLVYSSAPGDRIIELRDANGSVLDSRTINIPQGEVRVDLNFSLTPGVDYQLGLNGNSMVSLFRNNNGANYPYNTQGLVSVKRSSATSNPLGFYYFFYDWELQESPCYSERKAVTLSAEICGGVDESTLGSSIVMYPNPTNSQVTVDVSKIENQVFKINISTILGQIVREQQAVGGTQEVIQVSDLAPGNYIVTIASDGIYERRQLVVN